PGTRRALRARAVQRTKWSPAARAPRYGCRDAGADRLIVTRGPGRTGARPDCINMAGPGTRCVGGDRVRDRLQAHRAAGPRQRERAAPHDSVPGAPLRAWAPAPRHLALETGTGQCRR